jgi:cation diffusion facilitator CzcD-associated flavoprotein CzcO
MSCVLTILMCRNNFKDATEFAIIGSGFSGICMGIKLLQAGYRNFTIYEKSGEKTGDFVPHKICSLSALFFADYLGGTWNENSKSLPS